ncbi:hypothetical protein PtrSN002B_004202 [Pyrenophora tritici-repentis]|uniref:Uncharacterized protein n=1 Tax=Pyrenophora tritici-repentis TaxID=45151 RepID=A0A2W1CLI0_9PLEO|nr:hypothetical protein PtrV1_03090 [Pyrenophora tritici-repentis]KAF7442558.1 hypothetical protein A1F99_134270 [Pyrenophora tritici-repentis]KAF7579063.1 hypothetical protein PtrM4_033030 [Pyrenophora tritici-repentis]KAI0569134.1 hypothetical protein Alg215_11813 [Pyrenophora tritici-repentis]KAI0569329.1 hypothetical protein Alg130_11690 [Pyrenophora tritici-repentis]
MGISPIQTRDIAAVCEALSDTKSEPRQASNPAGAAQLDSSHLKPVSDAQSIASGGITEATTELLQRVELQMVREQAEYNKYVKAADKVLGLEQSLKAAPHLQGPICTVKGPHHCLVL